MTTDYSTDIYEYMPEEYTSERPPQLLGEVPVRDRSKEKAVELNPYLLEDQYGASLLNRVIRKEKDGSSTEFQFYDLNVDTRSVNISTYLSQFMLNALYEGYETSMQPVILTPENNKEGPTHVYVALQKPKDR